MSEENERGERRELSRRIARFRLLLEATEDHMACDALRESIVEMAKRIAQIDAAAGSV